MSRAPAACLALAGIIISVAGGLIVVAGARHDDAMEPGVPLFCASAVCMLVGLASWPKATREESSGHAPR